MIEEHAQALVDSLRAAGVARIIAPFHVHADSVEIGDIDLYEMNDNQLGGFSYDPVTLEDEETIRASLAAVLETRFAGKHATGKLMVDEEDRVWGDGVHEEELEPAEAAPRGLRVEL